MFRTRKREATDLVYGPGHVLPCPFEADIFFILPIIFENEKLNEDFPPGMRLQCPEDMNTDNCRCSYHQNYKEPCNVNLISSSTLRYHEHVNHTMYAVSLPETET